jgi:protein-tyrosine phosphatase
LSPSDQAPVKILFVCYGNICRSPMAAGIARMRLGKGVDVASAGIAAVGGPAAEDAQLVMKLVYKTDISGHEARSFSSYDPQEFDFIVAMDLPVYNTLKDIWAVPGDKLSGWDIEDPLGRGFDAFKTAAQRIEKRLDQFLSAHGLG